MADITLAEFNGRIWLVSDERWLDDLLIGTLPPEVSYEIIACESMAAVHHLWRQNCSPPEFAANPWLINPEIVDRLRRGGPAHAVYFGQWSALVDEEAHTVIAAAAAWAAENPAAPVVLTTFLDPAGPAAIADLARLRCHLIEEVLRGHGLDPTRLSRAERDVAEIPGMAQEAQRIDIVVQTG